MLLIIMASWILASQVVHAEVDWRVIKDIDLDFRPLDVAISSDGKLIFVLAAGEIIVHSNSENRVTNRIPIDKAFDRLTYSPRDNALILTSSSAKTLKILKLEVIHNIDLLGSPFIGPENAPVTIAVFGDYQ